MATSAFENLLDAPDLLSVACVGKLVALVGNGMCLCGVEAKSTVSSRARRSTLSLPFELALPAPTADGNWTNDDCGRA